MIARKYLAHYIDASFGESTTSYVKLGKNLEEYNEELNPDVNVTENIWNEQSVQFNGYKSQSDVDPFYYEDYEDTLSNKLMELANTRETGSKCHTTIVDVLLKPGETDGAAPTVVWAYREDVVIVINSVGGDTSGVQTPFSIYRAGNRVKGTWDVKAKTFTASDAAKSLAN